MTTTKPKMIRQHPVDAIIGPAALAELDDIIEELLSAGNGFGHRFYYMCPEKLKTDALIVWIWRRT